MTEKKDPLFNKIALVGIGLIGSSLALATRKNGLAKEITACARSQNTRDTAMRLGLVDAIYETPAEAVVDADLVILCTPVSTYDDLACAMAPSLKEGAIVTDVGSVKESVIRDVGPHLPDGIHFVPGHPIAGTEHSGPEAGFAELFEGRWCILTPVPGTNSKALDRITDYWAAMGSMVEIMTAHHHDKVLAITSHLPHLIAYTIVGTATDLEETQQADVVKFSAGGFRDFTRIAASDPIMWRDVFLNNREAVLEMLQRFSEDLSVLQRAVRWGEGDVLEDRFRKTRDIRRGIVDAHQAGTFDAREPDSVQD
ncbi:prephenate/arogenate dehydrogenase family protein [Kiloniella majae]|uniref:prephenate/arogenate dehydrogenase family protein n=1 Tax=Kiloniella majae TaxID=1938558 RepID=UPI000A2774A2|nr:prephenate/arogenate dehydrogenase family protein [Kiloniella majae]